MNKLEACTGTEQPKHLNTNETVRDMSPCRVCIDEAVSNAVKDPDNAMGTLHALLHVGYIWPVFLAKMKVLLISSLLSPGQFGDPKDLRTCGRWHKKTTGGPNLTNSLKSNFETLRENHVVEFWDGLCTEEFDNFLQKFEKIWQLCMAVEEEHRTRKHTISKHLLHSGWVIATCARAKITKITFGHLECGTLMLSTSSEDFIYNLNQLDCADDLGDCFCSLSYFKAAEVALVEVAPTEVAPAVEVAPDTASSAASGLDQMASSTSTSTPPSVPEGKTDSSFVVLQGRPLNSNTPVGFLTLCASAPPAAC